jgi:uncharacterized protein
MISSWSIPGASGMPILGDSHLPENHSPRRGVLLVVHGFKGYKDYGMFPRIASAAAASGFVSHRFNFSHSGMTNAIATFERPDLFEQDTWNKQVFDLRAVIVATTRGEIEGRGLPYVIFGHSRGGVAALLTAGRYADDPSFPQPAGLISAAAPATCNPLSEDEASLLLKQGFLESPSSRTGQHLRLGKAFLQQQLDDPPSHDLLSLIHRIQCPLLILHGENDPTVDPGSARAIASAAKSRVRVKIIPRADHVFNTPNPMPANAPSSPQLAELIRASIDFAIGCCVR